MDFVSVVGFVLIVLVSVGVATWMAGAIYFDLCGASRSGALCAVAWGALVVAGLTLWQPAWQPFLALSGIFALFLVWWFSQRPSNEREWNPNFAVLPRIEVVGGQITIHNLRHTDYRSREDFTPHYETRTYHRSSLVGVDVLIAYWGSSWMSHPMSVFDFGEDGRVTISIEVRYRLGQKYGFVRSLYRQQEIMYVVCDERDAILQRTKHSEGHDVYLYRLNVEPEAIWEAFSEYVTSVNALVGRPRWYNGITSNCTTTIYRQRSHEVDWDWRWLLNGQLDRMLYDRQRLNTEIPFEELKRQSRVNEIANRLPYDDLGDLVRKELLAYP